LRDSGEPDIGVTQIAHRLGVSPATLYRYIPAARTANTPRRLTTAALPQRPDAPGEFQSDGGRRLSAETGHYQTARFDQKLPLRLEHQNRGLDAVFSPGTESF
jgi:transposase-like protein